MTSLRIKSAGDAISPRWIERGLPALSGPIDAPDKTTAEGLFDLPYGFDSQHREHVATRMGVPVGFWRSVGHSHNPRYLAMLNLAAQKAGWGGPLPAGRA